MGVTPPWLAGGLMNFARFIRSPAPVVNDISLLCYHIFSLGNCYQKLKIRKKSNLQNGKECTQIYYITVNDY